MAELEPEDYFAHTIIGQVLTQQGRYEEAAPELQRAVAIMKGRPGRALTQLGYFYAVTGKRDEALKVVEQLKQQPGSRPLIQVAEIYAGLGDRDRAFALLEQAYEERYPLFWQLRVIPEFDSLRADPATRSCCGGWGCRSRAVSQK